MLAAKIIFHCIEELISIGSAEALPVAGGLDRVEPVEKVDGLEADSPWKHPMDIMDLSGGMPPKNHIKA